MSLVPTTIQGIPALALVTHYRVVRGSFSHNAPSDLDYRGYTEMEYEVCDRRGRAAPWLQLKMNEEDRMRVEAAIHEEMGE